MLRDHGEGAFTHVSLVVFEHNHATIAFMVVIAGESRISIGNCVIKVRVI